MATYFTNFSGYTVDAAPSDWTMHSLGTGTAYVRTDAGAPGGKVLEIYPQAGLRYTKALWTSTGLNADTDKDDVEVVAAIRWPDGTRQYRGSGVVARLSGGTQTSYIAGYEYNDREVMGTASSSIHTFTNSQTLSPTIDNDEIMFVRLRCNGTTIRSWYWRDGDTAKTNSDTPDLEYTDSSYTTGDVGLSLECDTGASPAKYVEVLWFGVGTNGDAAPMSAGETVVISGVSDTTIENGQTGVVITGTGFTASGNAVKISPTNNVADGSAVTQTITAQSTTSITITGVKGGLSFLTNAYLFVTNGSAESNASGTVVQIVPKVYVRENLISETGSAVATETGMTMVVYHAVPTTASPNPAQVIESVASNGSGAIDVQINRGSLAPGTAVWVGLMKDGSPAKGTMRKVTPVYE